MVHLFRFGPGFWLAFAIFAAATPAAAEQLVMPFACDAFGGDVRLTPSEPLPYRILGPRERHVYSVCSPVDPSRCRNWMIHRFDVDCGGRRVSWLEIMKVVSRLRHNRAWIDNGQMHLAVGATLSPDPGFAGGRAGRRGFEELDTVALPPGFAPTLGVPVQFQADGRGGPVATGDAPGGAHADGSWDAPASDALPRDARVAEKAPSPGWAPSPRTKPKTDKAAAAGPSKAPPTADKTAAPPLSSSAAPEKADSQSAASATASPARETKGPPAGKPETRDVSPSLSDAPVVPTIINGSTSGASGPSAETAPTSGISSAPQPDPGAHASPAPAERVESEVIAAGPAARGGAASAGETGASRDVPTQSGRAPGPRLLWIGLGLAGMLVLSLVFYATSRRREAIDARQIQPRDLGSVSFEGRPTDGGSLVAVTPAPAPVSAPSQPTLPPASGSVAAEVGVPSSLDEAFAVLGTHADAPTDVIKKIVDGLRQSWHVDLARTEADRAYRNLKMQQVNAAWDLILQSRRAAA